MTKSQQLKREPSLQDRLDWAEIMAAATPDALRQAREQLGWSQQRLGDQLGLCRQFVSDMERGRYPIDIRTWLSVLYLLSVYG